MIKEWKHQLVLNLLYISIFGALAFLLFDAFADIGHWIPQTVSLGFLVINGIYLFLPKPIQERSQKLILHVATIMMLAYWMYALYTHQTESSRVFIMFAIALTYPLALVLEFILLPVTRALKESIAKILLMAAVTLPYAIMTRNASEALTGFSVLVISLTYLALLLALYNLVKHEKQGAQATAENKTLGDLTFIDALTGIPNRHSAEAMLAQAIATTQTTFSVVLIDLDHFKNINDTYGHPTGDRVLQQFSTFVKRKLRGPDMAARWGGEEFLLIALDTDTPGCLAITERLQEDMKQVVFPVPELTFSGGIATYQPGDTAASLIERADHALHQAKSSGRNRLRFWGPVNLNISYTQH